MPKQLELPFPPSPESEALRTGYEEGFKAGYEEAYQVLLRKFRAAWLSTVVRGPSSTLKDNVTPKGVPHQ